MPDVYEPFDSDDFVLFLPALKRFHYSQRGRFVGHRDSSPCEECDWQANWALIAAAGRARNNGWNRAQAIEYLHETPGAVSTFVESEGGRRERANDGKASNPLGIAMSKKIERVLLEAHEEGELSQGVEMAQRLLGLAIRNSQDATYAIEFGYPIPFGGFAEELELDREDLIQLWGEVVAACDRTEWTTKQLDKHVFRRSENASRSSASAWRAQTDDESDDDLISQASTSLTGGEPKSPEYIASFDLTAMLDEAIEQAVAMTVNRGSGESAVVRDAVDEALSHVLGQDLDAEGWDEVLEDLVEGTIEAAGRELAIRGAAEAVSDAEVLDRDLARRALLERLDERHVPKDLRMDADAYAVWLEHQVDIVLRLARRAA